jgi:3-oxoadipate enol-lactonase
MPLLDIEGTRLAYDETGAGAPLVLVHPAIADRRMWDPVVPLLAGAFRVIRYDARGFGDSPAANGPSRTGCDLAGVITLARCSSGAADWRFDGRRHRPRPAAQQPDLVERMVVVAPGIEVSEPSPAMIAFWDAEDAALERDDLDEASEINVRMWLDGPMRASSEVDPAVRSLVFVMQRRAFELANPDSVEERPAEPLRLRLPSIAAPMLVMVGELDQPDSRAVSQEVAAAAADARFVSMPGVAHLPPLEAPEAFVELVRPFLES